MSRVAAVLMIALSACVEAVDAPVDAAPPSDGITPLRGPRASTWGAFEVGNLWPKDDLSVCWMPEVYDSSESQVLEVRQIIEEIVMREWHRVGRIRLNGGQPWWSCASLPDADIRIGMTDIDLGRSAIGTDAIAIPLGEPTMWFNFYPPSGGGCPGGGGPGGVCDNASPGALTVDETQNFQWTALHEFGHALGLRHEHARADSLCDPLLSTEVLDVEGYDGEPLWAYDAASVMGYCYQSDTNGVRLSIGDIRALHTLYPGVVGLFANTNLGSSQPIWIGPGYYTTTQIPQLTTISSIVVPPGYQAVVCTTQYCAALTATARTLSSTYDNHIVNIAVGPRVVVAHDVGFGGLTQPLTAGVHRYSTGHLATVGDNTISSAFVPPTRAAVLCAGDSGAAPCSGPHVGGGEPTAVKLPSGVDNAVSYVDVSARVVTYSDKFRGTSYALAPGVYKQSTNAPWLPNVRALAIASLDVRACTQETGIRPWIGGGGDCRSYSSSVDLAAAAHLGLRYLEVSIPPTNAPP